MAKPKIAIGTTFTALHADTNAKWTVMKKRGAAAWECQITECEDYGGTKRVFGSEEIIRSLGMGALFSKLRNAHEDFWASRKIGEIVHYRNGFGQYVRGVVVEQDGAKMMRPTALVGAWRSSDLPHYNAHGEVVCGHYATRILVGDVMQPNAGNIVEAEPKAGEDAILAAPAIDLSLPERTEAQEEAHRLKTLHEAVVAALKLDFDLDPVQRLQEALGRARAVLKG